MHESHIPGSDPLGFGSGGNAWAVTPRIILGLLVIAPCQSIRRTVGRFESNTYGLPPQKKPMTACPLVSSRTFFLYRNAIATESRWKSPSCSGGAYPHAK